MIGGAANIARIPELMSRIWFTLGMLLVYRVGAKIATPGVDPDVVRQYFETQGGGVFGLFNVFSGGALESLSIFTLGIMPYISASIILQLLTVVVPQLEALKKEGEQGQKKITGYTRYATIVLALFQSAMMARALETGSFGTGAVVNPGFGFYALTIITLTTGTAFIMWLGEQITERGIGNGISMVIFSGIVVSIPGAIAQVWELINTEQLNLISALFVLGLIVLVIGAVFFVESGQRRIPIQHARRVVGRQMTQGGLTYFPLRVNTAGVIPPIFASSLLVFPSTIAQFSNTSASDQGVGATIMRFIQDYLNAGGWVYNGVYVALIVFFAFFYTAIVINPDDVAENLKRQGGAIPGVRPGQQTSKYIDGVLSRLTLVGAIYISAICILPVVLSTYMGLPFYFGGTALLIVVGVSKDLLAAIEAHLLSHQYQGFVQGVRMRGRFNR
ncbi:MAG: preprotein translocase subunit SecY [Deltaproteobacteria bacterium]|nr:preprotein translocase subunit SecY [Deltaproteobacteria bacterium]